MKSWPMDWCCGSPAARQRCYGQGAQEQHRWCPGYRSPIRHRGAHEKKVELSHIFISKELVIFKLFCKSTAAAMTSATPAAVKVFFCALY